jgi:hypothetical protein
VLVGGGPTRNVPRRSGSVGNSAAGRGALGDGNIAFLSTHSIAFVILVYIAWVVGLDSAILVWSWDWWHGGKALR